MELKIADSWKNILQVEFEKPYFKDLTSFVANEYQNSLCFPEQKDIFAAFDFCSFDDLKVVVLGQDPYHGEGSGQWLVLFCTRRCIKHPPSLVNIFKEMAADLSDE